MELTKEQSLKVILENEKIKALKHRWKFTTKHKWWCITCMCDIFVSYRQYGRNSIFCPECYKANAKKETIAQYHFMRVLKEKQMELIERTIDSTLKEIEI